MQKDIHPEYGEAVITCTCGNVMNMRSTVKQMHVNTCSACHPFYTGRAQYLDTAGRVEQFNRRYGVKK